LYTRDDAERGGSPSHPTRRDVLKKGAAGSIVLGAGGVIAACGGSKASTTATSATTPTATPKRGGTVRIGSAGGRNDVLDPHNYFPRTAFCGVHQLFEGLARRDAKFVPRMFLAEEVTAEKADVWTIRVRQGVEFHNGKTVSADDVMFTLRRIITLLGADARGYASVDLKRMKKLDDRTVRLHLKRPDVTILAKLANNLDYVVPVGFDPKKPVGTGPFKLVSMTPGEKMTFARNPNYWQSGKPYLDGLEILTLTDATARVNALLGGQVQAIEGLPFGQVSVVKANSKLKVLESETGQFLPFVVRVDVKPWSDVRVRQALRLLADRKQLIAQGLAGHGRVANDIFSPYDTSYNKDLQQRNQDLEQAKSLLKAAGQENLTATLVTSNIYSNIVDLAQVLVQQAKAAGVTLKLQELDPTVFFGPRWLSYPLTQDFWTNRDYLTTAGLGLAPNGAYNETHWNDKEWGDRYSEAVATLDDNKRTELIHECQRIEWERGGNVIWGFANFVDALAANVAGLEPDVSQPLGGYGFGNAFLT